MFRLLREGLSVMRELFIPLMVVTTAFACLYNAISGLPFLLMASAASALFWVVCGCSALIIARAADVWHWHVAGGKRFAFLLGTVLVLLAIEAIDWVGFAAAERMEAQNRPLSLVVRVVSMPLFIAKWTLILSPAIALVHSCHPISCMKASAVAIFGNAGRFGALFLSFVAAWVIWQFIPNPPGGRDPVVISVLGGLLWLFPASVAGLVVVRSHGKPHPEVRLRALPPAAVSASSALVAALLGAFIYALLTSVMPIVWPLPVPLYYHLVFLAPSTVPEVAASLLCGMGAGWLAARISRHFRPALLAGLVFGVIVLARPWFLYDSEGLVLSELVLLYAICLSVFSVAGAVGGLLARRTTDPARSSGGK